MSMIQARGDNILIGDHILAQTVSKFTKYGVLIYYVWEITDIVNKNVALKIIATNEDDPLADYKVDSTMIMSFNNAEIEGCFIINRVNYNKVWNMINEPI